MNKFRFTMMLLLIVEVCFFVMADLYLVRHENVTIGKEYRVEMERAMREMAENTNGILKARNIKGESSDTIGAQNMAELSEEELDDISHEVINSINLKKYPNLIRITRFHASLSENVATNSEYRIGEVNGLNYRFEYKATGANRILLPVNLIFGALLLLTLLIVGFVDQKIMKPMKKMEGTTTELAKGNLVAPLEQDKSGYFKNFIWSVDMLREKMEADRAREMELVKEQKSQVLSLSHDIKTPLSAIDLYAKALQMNLYTDEEKKNQALAGILSNTEDIKKYVKEIADTSREDFLGMEVNLGEEYLVDVITPIQDYYKEKLALIQTEFAIDDYSNNLISCDKDRLIEVIQNCMENAIKYGDGKKITITFGEEENCKLITVSNTGCTLKIEEVDSIFDSFYRGSNSKGVTGSGLGLYICKELLHQMNGDIYANASDNEFQVTLVVRKL